MEGNPTALEQSSPLGSSLTSHSLQRATPVDGRKESLLERMGYVLLSCLGDLVNWESVLFLFALPPKVLMTMSKIKSTNAKKRQRRIWNAKRKKKDNWIWAKAARLRLGRRGARLCLEVRRKSTDKESMNKGSSTDKERSPTIIIQWNNSTQNRGAMKYARSEGTRRKKYRRGVEKNLRAKGIIPYYS